MAKPKNGRPRPDTKKPEALRSIYARVRREFSAADLQRYTEPEPSVPADQLLAELEAIDRSARRRRSPS
jgi:hypothetical protein